MKIYIIIFVKKKKIKCEQLSANYYLSATRSNQIIKQLFVPVLLSDINKYSNINHSIIYYIIILFLRENIILLFLFVVYRVKNMKSTKQK